MSRRLGEFVPLSTTYADDDAILMLSPLAELLFLRGNALAGQLSSDGYLTEAQVIYRAARKLGTEKKARALARELVDAGVWAQQDGGYTIRAWLKWNKSTEELGRERARDRDRKRAERSGQAPESGGSPPSVQPDTGGTPDGIREESGGSHDGVQADSGGSLASRTHARGGARRAVVAASGSATSRHGTERHDTLPGAPDKPESPGAHANRLADIWHDLMPMSNHQAAAKIIGKAIAAGVDDEQIVKGLNKLAEENRGLSTEQLRIAIYGPPKKAAGDVGEESTSTQRARAAVEAGRRAQAMIDGGTT